MKVLVNNQSEYITETLDGQPLPFKVKKLNSDHPFIIAHKRHSDGLKILENLNHIEAFRLDAFEKSKTAVGEEKENVLSALAILSNKRAEAKRRAVQYLEDCLSRVKSL